MAVTNNQTAVHAAALADRPRGASGGTARGNDAYATAFKTWLDANDTDDADNTRAALLAAAASMPGSPADRITAYATDRLAEIESRTIVSIAVTPLNPSVAHPNTQQFVATATYQDGETGVITTEVVWASATPADATIAQTGLATTVSTGSSAITAAKDGVTSPASTLTVT